MLTWKHVSTVATIIAVLIGAGWTLHQNALTELNTAHSQTLKQRDSVYDVVQKSIQQHISIGSHPDAATKDEFGELKGRIGAVEIKQNEMNDRTIRMEEQLKYIAENINR